MRGTAGLDGEWQPVAAEVSGRPLDVAVLRVARLRIEHDSYDILDQASRQVDRGALESATEPDAPPGALDLVGTEGPAAGRRLRALSELDGDRLCICYDLEREVRPASMQPLADQLLLRITYTRLRRRAD
ncbi:MAG: TIGR03067 domain-containing protein [Gammaproteobacteria bacterium]|nr:TIGR03067 domain-containing protein [Gammaproteobacteria bacterium]